MKLLVKESLFQTVDNVSNALFFNQEISKNEKIEVADFIASRHGKPNAYAGTFAPTETDLENNLVLFTGEKIKTNAGKRHMIGEETLRILRKLNIQNENVNQALFQADEDLFRQIENLTKHSNYGMYCCKSCSCSMWLNLSSGGFNNNQEMLVSGLKLLKYYRDGNGSWKGFPFYYLLYVLNEIEINLVNEELNYAAALIEKRLNINRKGRAKYLTRRNSLMKQILEKVV